MAERSTLPAPPELIRPIEDERVRDSIAELRWEPVEDADEYGLQVARGPHFTDTLYNDSVGEVDTFTIGGLPTQAGVPFYWRVRTRKGDQWGPFSKPARFRTAGWRAGPAITPTEEEEAAEERAQNHGEWAIAMFAILFTGAVILGASFWLVGGDVGDTNPQEPEAADTTAAAPDEDLDAYAPAEEEGYYRIPLDRAIDLLSEDDPAALVMPPDTLDVPDPDPPEASNMAVDGADPNG